MIWYFDSGASKHITSRKDLFCSLDAAPAGKKVTCANNASYPIKGVGKLENGLFVLNCYEKQIQACIAETKTQAMQDAELWHARFGHVGYGSLMTLQRHNMVQDLSLLEMPPRHVCEGCVLGKMHRFAFSQDGFVRATRKLQLVHSDVCGPMRTPSVGNSLYFVTFIDDFSRFCWVYPLNAKSDVFAIFQHYVSMVENETGCKVQTLRTDRGGEYMSGEFKDFLGKKGIKHQCTMPYTPQQNGVAKRKNGSLMEMARCMLKAKSLPHKLWMEAVACVAHVLNRCPTHALKTITPYESWYDRKPSISYLRVFGCLAYAHIPHQLRGKLDDKAVKCIFVGYNSGSKGYRLYNPATNKIFESRDVIFAKTTAQPMVAFDVPHMQTQDVFEGFLPSFVENQESQQVDNFDQSFDQHVTPHDVEEIVREEQKVLKEERTLPKWVRKTLQDSKLDAPLPWKTRAARVVSASFLLLSGSFSHQVQHFLKADNNIDVFKMFAAEDRLDGDNYPMWAYMMQHVLVSKGVWNIVQGIDVRPGTVDVAELWMLQAHALIALSVKRTITPHIRSAKSAKQAWDIIAGLYAGRNEAKVALLRKELESKIMNEEDDMDTFLTGIKDINEQLISAGEIISDSFLVQTILDALPDSYQTFASTWQLMNQRNPDVVKFDEVCTLLLQEALSRKNRSRQRAVEQAFIAAQRRGGNSNAATSHGSSASGRSPVPNASSTSSSSGNSGVSKLDVVL
ncbi:hypothetical protein L7F22_016826 [Adiantum nelumboides]|nr:hypothetical protein [Adiantum nelumboides]